MLSNFSHYSPQGFIPQFPGLQGAGWPQMSPGLFGQPGTYSGYVPFAHEPTLAGMYPSPFPQTPFLSSPFSPGPFSPTSFAPSPFVPGSFAGYAGAHHPAQQIVVLLGQLAQQISVQTAVTQQISIGLQQLVHQLAVQGLHQTHPGALGAFGGQYFAQSPFTGATQAAYGGFTPPAQAWGANRAQTIH